MTNLDWVIAAVVVLSALGGYRRGLIRTVFWLVGLIAGAVVGARLAPHFLSAGPHSRYTAAVGLVGAFAGVAVCQLLTALAAKLIRGGLHLLPPLHLLDSLGGLALGGVWGLALCWVVGAVALQIPGHPKMRRDVRQSRGAASPERGGAAARCPPHREAVRVLRLAPAVGSDVRKVVEHRRRPPVRRDDVDAVAALPRLVDQPPRVRHPDRRPLPGRPPRARPGAPAGR